MKKPTFSKAVFAVFILLLSFTSVAQTYKTFSIRKKIDIRGKMIVAGNNILGKDNFSFNDDKLANQNIDMKYIDIDADGSTFSSSSADLVVPNKVVNGTPTSIPTSCYRVAYAALYWGALLQSGSRSDINKVKLKLPGAVSYNDISGTIVYDAGSSGSGIDSKPGELPNKPYACYADVTSLLSTLSNINGTYTVANVISSEGSNGSTGLSAGWTLFVVYEDPSLNMKSFNVFDGFSQIFNTKVEDVPVTGFITPQAGNVDLQFAYAALDGDKTIGATKLEFESHQVVTPLRPANEFFNASIENTNGVSTPRNPSGSNTLGYDTGVLEVKGAEPEYIRNNQTSTSFALQVANGKADPVFAFFGAYAVDIIAPKIDLTKIVKNTSGVDIGGGNVNLAQSLVYEISYQSTGNDNVKNFTIKDVLPQNLVFNPATGIDYTNAGGATLQSYDAATRTLIFNIPSTSVTVNGGLYTIGLKVQVAPDCNSLATACSNEIKNQAFATYQGVINTNVVKEEGSYASTVCKLGSPESTNFIVDISNCKFTKNVILCGSSVVLKASDGYTNYSWSRNPDGSSPIGTGQTFTATQTGIYYVHNTAPLTCKDIVEEITVTHFGVTNTNPVIPFADQLVTCANDGKVLPNIFLCGANATRSIKTGISDAASIVWEKLDEIICPSTAIANCANENFANSCWKQVGTGPDYLANTQGQFRVTLNYSGGCFSIFYFNVYQNLLDPTYTKKDIVCTTPGKITIVGVPSGYEFSLDGVNYQLNNPEFIITTAGSYTVYIKQQGVTTNPCIFQVPNILINNRTMNVRTFVTQPSCNGINDGSIKLIAENVEPQYYFSIEKGGALINSVVPTATNEHTFANLSPGSYTVKVSTDDNCTYTATVDIINPPLIKVTANVTKPITCIDGEITINIEGGTPNYNYYVNGTDVLLNSTLTSFAVPVSTAGTYDIKVDDLNNCPAVTSVPVSAIPAPVYTVTSTNILCYGSGTGEIQFNVTNANGYTLAYSIDNGVTYLPTPTFSNLAAGTYNTIVRYTLGTSVCYGAMQAITITEPNSAVTASAGVSELAGCTLSGQGGKLRITNPQGGVAPYLYSFDNQATWVTTNEADMLPGTYTLYVKDANGCIYPMPNVVLDPKPVAPTIDVSSPVFNCNGTANSTVTVTNSGSASYQYDYLLDGTANTNVPSNVFVNVPTGSHTVSVTYKLLTVPTYSNLLFEDFGKGAPTTTPGINPAYCFEDQHFPNGNCNGGRDLVNNEYSVTSKIQIPWSGWVQNIRDTTVPLDPNGRFLAIDIGSAAGPGGILYSKTIKDIIPNKDILVDFNAINLYQAKYSSKADPNLKIELVYDLGKPTEYKVPNSNPNSFNVPKTEAWIPYKVTLNPGAYTTLSFVIRSNSTQYDGNDVGIDDIRVYQLPTSCLSQVDFPFEVPTGKAFTGSVTGFKDITCAGANNGEITIAVQNFDTTAGFQYSIDGGSTWQTSTISPVTIKNLVAGTYTPQLRYNAAGACPLTLSPVTIKQPTPLTVTATVMTQATCTTGASITAVANGGTPAYQYELRQSNGVTVVTAFNANAVFTNVAAGNYSVFAKDANGCITSIGAAVNVVAPPVLTATLDPTSDLCYDTVNQATLKVTITGGTSPFVYSLDGAAAQNTNTFTNVGFGTHNILVTDSKNCTATIANIVIAKQLLASAVVSKPLDCTTSPNAKIDVTITDGTAPYTYKVKLNAGGYGSSINVTGNTIPYSAVTAGIYTFEITDAKSCQTTTTATISSITNPTATAVPTDPTCNNETDGQIQIVGSGGAGGFAYSLNGGAFGARSLYTGLNANTTTANTTVYTYQVRDSKQCLSPVYSVTLNNPTKVVAAATIPANTACSTSTVVTVTASGGAGGYTYSFNGSSTYTGVNTLPVTYTNAIQTVTYSVKDSKGCIDTKTISIPAFNPPTGIIFAPGTAITCNTTTTSITLTSVGGIAPLTYTIVSGPSTNTSGATSGVFTNLLPGDYVFQVTDANGCTKQASTTINSAPVIAVSGVKTDVKCFGSTDGTAIFTITGVSSSGNFTYTLIPSVPAGQISIAGNVVTVTGLGAKTYSLVVKDNATGCSSNTASVTINPATPILITRVTASNVNCNNSISNIVVTATGGVPNFKYAYVISGAAQPLPAAFSNTNTTINTGATQSNRDWDVYVMDQNDCIAGPFGITILRDASPSVKSPAPAPFCFKAPSSTPIDVSTFFNLGTGVHTYTVNGLAIVGKNYNITGSGTYTIVAKDANGCSATATYVVQPELTILATRVKDLDCISDGQITFVASNGTSPYTTYEVQFNGAGPWSAVTSPYTVSVAGDYQFRVTDTAGCQALSNIITITPKTLPSFAHNEKQPTCIGASDGVINITNPTGLAPFTYLISKGGVTSSITATATGLNAGVYDVLLTDSKGCTASLQITLTDPAGLSATVSSTPILCNADNTTKNATITVTAPSGGSGTGYEYSFNGGAFSAIATYSTSVAGIITVEMRDSNHCTQSLPSQNFAALNPPTITGFNGSLITCKPGEDKSNVDVLTNNGVAPLKYIIVSGPTNNTTGVNDGKFTGLTDGNYVFQVTDANGCSAKLSYTVKPVVNITASLLSQVNVACNGGITGSAAINVSAFKGTYTATLTVGTGTVAPIGSTASGTVNVTGLVQGAYTLRVTDDATGCFKDIDFTITEPSPLSLALVSNKNANCNQLKSKVTVTGGGGKAPYSYAFISSPSPTKPAPGDYIASVGTSFSADLDPATPTWYAWVKDANGCETPLTVNIVKDDTPSVTLPAQQCFTGTPFSITLSGTGTGTLTYSVNGSTIPGNTYSITAAGTYKLGVTDANGCTDIKDYIVEKQLLATAILDKDITCSVPTAASITVNITNGTAPFTYQIYNGASTVGSPVTGIMASSFTETFNSPGNYSFQITDSKGCVVNTNILPVTPTVDPVMNPVTLQKSILCKGESTAEITVTYDNTIGTAPFVINVKQYLELAHITLVKDFGTQTSGLPAGFYAVTVTDAKGCSAKEDIIITEPDPITVTFTPNYITCVSGAGTSKGSIVVNTATGGSGSYTYQVTNNNGYSDTQTGSLPLTFNLIDFGNYQLRVTDSNGCAWLEQDIPIASPPNSLELVITPSTPVCGALGSAEVKVGVAVAGTLPFHFSIYQPGSQYTAPQVGTWYDEDGLNSLKATIPGLIPGVTYTFIVYDENTKCYYYQTFTNTVPSKSTLKAKATGVPITCKGEADGSVNLEITSTYSAAINVKYEIFNAATLISTGIVGNGSVDNTTPLTILNFGGKPTYTGLSYGTYYVLITETSGGNSDCTMTTLPFSITESTFDLEIEASSSKNDNCATNAGIITAIGKKGTGPYTYAIVADSAAQPTSFASTNTFAVESGDWDVYVKDAYGCIQKADVNVPLDPTPGIALITPSSNCYSGTVITVTVTPNATILGPVTYSVDKGATIGSYGNSASFTLTPGTYTLNVKDGNGCIASAPYIIKDQLTLTPTLTKGLDCITASPNATITVKAEGGNTVPPASYTYTITAGPTINATGATTGIFTGLAAGNYTFEVTDGTCTATTTMSIDALVPIVPNKTVGTPLCVGGSASVEIKATGGTGVYTYQKGSAPTLPTETVNIFTQTAAEGTVTYYVKDSKGCVETIDVIVTDPSQVVIANIDVIQMTCGGGNVPNEASITVTAANGAGGYEYSFDNGVHYSDKNIFTTTIAKTYDIIVRDANGCLTTMQSIPINPLDPPVITGFTKTQMTCPALVSDVTILHTNGIAPLTFKIVSGPGPINITGDISGTYTGLAAGDYVFRVTDSNNCTDEELYTIPSLPTLQIQPQVDNNVSCFGGANGKATFTASDFTASGAFTYSVVTTPTGLTFTDNKVGDVLTLTDLAKGHYEVTFRDNTTLCSVTKSVDISEPAQPLAITASASNVNCNNSVSLLTMNPTGGTPNYTYSIVQSGSGAGTYSNSTSINTATLTNGVVVGLGMTWLVDVHIKDANNCTAMTTITITKDDTPTVTTPTLADNQCTTNGNYTFTATGTGVAPLSFSIDGTNYFVSAGNTYTFTVPAPTLASQSYTVYIKDGNGCPATSTTSTTVYKPLKLNVVEDKDITCVAMPATTAAQFTLTAADGNPGYTYEVNINNTGFIPITSPYTTSIVGTYVFRVTDSNSCSVTSEVINVVAPATPTFSTVKTNVTCNGGNNGSITVTPANGIAPYTFALTGPVTNNTGDTTGIYTGLIAGSYNVVVTDAYGCTSTVATPIVVGQPSLLSATTAPFAVKTNCDIDTNVKVVASGGTLPYYYDFGAGYDTVDNITVNDNGSDQTINYSVKDGNGCTFAGSVTVFKLNSPTSGGVTGTTIYCAPVANTTSTVTVKAKVGTGVGSLTYVIVSGPTTNATGAASGVFTGLTAGDYIFQVTDVNGCSYQDSYTVQPVRNIAVTGQLIANMSCNVGDDGKVSFDVSNFSGNYTYTITKDGVSFVPSTSSSSATIPLTGLGFGVYKIDVTDSTTLCTSTVSVTVAQPSVVTVAEVSNTAANCTSNALVKVAGSGGTPGYTYAYRVSGSSTALVFSASDTASLDPALGTVWDFYAKDINGCISAPLTVNISTDPLPSGFSATATSLCPNTAGTFDITVNVGSGMGPFEYSIGSGFQSSTLFTVNVPKAYDLIVKDKFGCTATFTAVVTLLEPIALQTNITALPSCANNDGTITASATGGSGNYSYQLDGGTAINAPTANFTGLASGSHTIMVTDLNNGCSDSVILNLVPATQVTGFNLNATNVTCNGGNDGTITATMTTPAPGVNDNPIYTYTLSGTDSNGPVNVGPQQGNMFNNLRAGSYTVTVTSGRGCSATLSVPVTEPGVITVPTPTVAPFGCTSGSNAMNFATITVNGVTGGSGTDYNYEFFRNGMPVQRGASNVYTEADFAGGNYSVTVYDSNGCAGSNLTPLIIAPFTPMDKIDVVVNQAINCTNPENITVTAVDASGVAIAGVQYTIEGKDGITGAIVYPAQTNTTGVFTGLSVANYIITATNPATGCSIQDVHYVSEPNTFDLTIDNIVDVTCFGGANGSANVTLIDRVPLPTNEAGPFTYTLKDALGNSLPGGSSTATGTLALTNLAAGTYTITATLIGSPYCSVSKVFTINRPTAALNINTTHTEITCVAGNNDGTITASATGGWPGGYQFQLVGPVNVAYSAQTNFTGLTAGSYTLNVRDSKGCVATTTVNLSNPTPIVFTVSPSATTLSCFGDRSASITASMPTGGQGSNYLYTLNTTSLVPATSNGPQTSSVFNGLGAGTYTITVTDGYSCSATSAPITISEPAKVIASLIVASTQTCTTQTRLTLSANGGTSPYTYSSDGTTYGASFASSVSINVSPGTYHYYVKDANGCVSSVSNDIKIDPLVPLTINLDKLNPVINCAGDSNGVITADAQGGLGNYVYTLTNVDSGVATAPQSSGVFNGLIAGNYKVHVDSGDCTEEVLVTITQPTSVLTASAATIPVTCSGNGDGKIVITASGGTGEIRYAISPNSDQFFVGNIAGGHSFNNLKPGFYTIIAQDQNGCFHLETVEITEPTPLTSIVDALSIKQELCAGERTGEFTIGITGGTAPYSTSIDGDAFVLDRVSFTGLSGGKHTVIVKDANLCEFTLDELLNPAVTLDPQELVSNDCVNDLPANKVTVTVDPSNIPSDVTYSLDSSGVWQNSNVFTNLTPGNHFVMVQHKNGCVDATNPFTIDQVDPLTISIDLGGLNEIVATVTGGSGVYQFTVNGESIGSNNKYIYFHSGNYTVTVTDSYGCSLSTTKYFEFIDITIPPIFTPNGDGTSDNWKPTNTENYPDIKFIVYDRYGRQVGVFGAGQSWDGKYNGTELPMGDYWYILKLRHRQDDREFVGHFTLYR